MRLMASLVCAIESTRSLRCVVRNVWRVSSSSNCSIAIMLTGPSRSIFARRAAIASSALSVRCSAATIVGSDRRRPASVACDSSSSSRSSSGSSAQIDAGVRDRVPFAFELRRPRASTSSSVAWTASTHAYARCDRSLSAVARATSSSATTARTASSAPRASLIDGFELVGPAAQRRHRVVGRHDVLTQRVELAHVGVELRFAGRDRRPQLVDAALRVCRARRRARRTLLELERRFFEPPDFGRQRAARSTRAACAAPASAARRLRSSAASRASNSRRCADVRRSSATRCSASSRAIDARASSWRRSSASRSSSAWRRSRASCSRLLREPRRLVGGALQLRLVADDRLFLLVMLGVQRGDRVRRLGDRALELRRLLREPGQAPRARRRSDRAAP